MGFIFAHLNVRLENNSWLLFFLKGQLGFIQLTRSSWEYYFEYYWN